MIAEILKKTVKSMGKGITKRRSGNLKRGFNISKGTEPECHTSDQCAGHFPGRESPHASIHPVPNDEGIKIFSIDQLKKRDIAARVVQGLLISAGWFLFPQKDKTANARKGQPFVFLNTTVLQALL